MIQIVPEQNSAKRLLLLQNLIEILFSIHLPLSLVYGLFLYQRIQFVASHQSLRGTFDVSYLWLRASVRINDFLHLGKSWYYSEIRLPSPGSRTSMELGCIVPVACIGVLLYALLRKSRGTTVHRAFTVFLCGVAAFFLLPAVQLGAEGIDRDSLGLSILSAEAFLFLALFLINRWKHLSLWALLPLSILHYLFWSLAAWEPNLGFAVYELSTPRFSAITSVALGIVWIIFQARAQGPLVDTGARRSMGKAIWLSSGIAVVILVLLLGTVPGPSLIQAHDRKNIEIVMQRSACYGSCPIYSVKVRGDGTVEYLGQEFVIECGNRESSITQEQFEEILRAFDKSDFFTLEDRAFVWTFDVSSAFVTITADGRTKTVRAQTWSELGLSSQQTQFSAATKDLDAIVGTARWIGRGGYCGGDRGRASANK